MSEAQDELSKWDEREQRRLDQTERDLDLREQALTQNQDLLEKEQERIAKSWARIDLERAEDAGYRDRFIAAMHREVEAIEVLADAIVALAESNREVRK
jgi:hypothetical protein